MDNSVTYHPIDHWHCIEKHVGGYRPIFVYGQVKVNYRDELILEQLRPIFTNIKILLFIMLHYRG